MIIKYYTKHNRKDYWMTMNDIIYTIGFNKVIIKGGFIFDGGSIPNFAWMFTYHPLQMPFLEYFILHDYFYSCKYKGIIGRKEADLILFGQIKNFSIIKAIIIYISVRLFGWLFYKKPLEFILKKYE